MLCSCTGAFHVPVFVLLLRRWLVSCLVRRGWNHMILSAFLAAPVSWPYVLCLSSSTKQVKDCTISSSWHVIPIRYHASQDHILYDVMWPSLRYRLNLATWHGNAFPYIYIYVCIYIYIYIASKTLLVSWVFHTSFLFGMVPLVLLKYNRRRKQLLNEKTATYVWKAATRTSSYQRG